jgi:hypothetical protein
VRHGAPDCIEKKACNVRSCKLSHHPLKHNEAAHGEASTNHAVSTEADLISLGMVQLAVASDGELVPMIVLIDPGSNSSLSVKGPSVLSNFMGTDRRS